MHLFLKLQTYFYIASSILFAGAVWAVNFWLVHIVGNLEFGEFLVALSVCTPIFIFFGIQMRVKQAADIDFRISDLEYLFMRFAQLSVGTILLILAYTLICHIIPNGNHVGWDIFLAVCGYKFTDFFAESIIGNLQRSRKFQDISAINATRALIVILSCIPLTFFSSIASYAWSYAVLNSILFAFLTRNQLVSGQKSQLNISRAFSFWKAHYSLGLSQMLDSLITTATRVITTVFFGFSVVGALGILMQIQFAPQLIVSSLNQIATPQLAEDLKSGKPSFFFTHAKKILFHSIFLGGILLLTSKLIIENLSIQSVPYFFLSSTLIFLGFVIWNLSSVSSLALIILDNQRALAKSNIYCICVLSIFSAMGGYLDKFYLIPLGVLAGNILRAVIQLRSLNRI